MFNFWLCAICWDRETSPIFIDRWKRLLFLSWRAAFVAETLLEPAETKARSTRTNYFCLLLLLLPLPEREQRAKEKREKITASFRDKEASYPQLIYVLAGLHSFIRYYFWLGWHSSFCWSRQMSKLWKWSMYMWQSNLIKGVWAIMRKRNKKTKERLNIILIVFSNRFQFRMILKKKLLGPLGPPMSLCILWFCAACKLREKSHFRAKVIWTSKWKWDSKLFHLPWENVLLGTNVCESTFCAYFLKKIPSIVISKGFMEGNISSVETCSHPGVLFLVLLFISTLYINT